MKVGITNRIAIYWIPIILVILGARELAWFRPTTFDLGQGIIFVTAAAVFVLACEYFLFGFRVEFSSHELIYRFRGFPFPRKKQVARAQIRRARYEAAARIDHKPWRFVEVVVDGPQGQYSLRINLTGFSGREVEMLLEWLPNLERAGAK